MPQEDKNQEDKKDVNPYDQLLAKLNTLEQENKTLKEQVSKMDSKFNDFKAFNEALLNQAGSNSAQNTADEKKKERMQYLDKICRKGEY